MSREFAVFVVVGGFAAVVNIASRLAFNLVMSYEIAVVAAYLCGMATAFLLNRAFVFKGSATGNTSRQGARFALVNLVALAQVWVCGVGLARLAFPYFGFTWHAETVAHAIGVASPVLTSYFAHKYFSFAPERPLELSEPMA
jgi:putative flippase GtrA